MHPGLELLQRLQNEYPEIITIAISGYDDFDKVKGVFVSGGLDYLLKPVGKEEMVKVLTKALGLLEERENTKKQDETSRLFFLSRRQKQSPKPTLYIRTFILFPLVYNG